ncbi:hypothetical protein H1C71_035497 [Ictidomys tridecemlineatus]|nr:hypothetical protein H1C71_035497 [Ictidomys tridecemlineatus]
MGTWAALLQEGCEHRRSCSPQTLDSLVEPVGYSQARAQEPREAGQGMSQGVEGQQWLRLLAGPTGLCFLIPCLRGRIRKRKGDPWGWPWSVLHGRFAAGCLGGLSCVQFQPPVVWGGVEGWPAGAGRQPQALVAQTPLQPGSTREGRRPASAVRPGPTLSLVSALDLPDQLLLPPGTSTMSTQGI